MRVPYVNRAAFLSFDVDVGGEAETRAAFLTAGSLLRQRVREELERIGEDIAARARAAAPMATKDGGQLRASIAASKVAETPDGKELGIVIRPWGRRRGQKARYGNFAIGIFSEGGLRAKAIYVHPFVRQVGSTSGFLETRRLKRSTKVKFGEVSARVQFVGGYTRRRQPIAARPFMAPAFNAVSTSIEGRIQTALESALQGIAA